MTEEAAARPPNTTVSETSEERASQPEVRMLDAVSGIEEETKTGHSLTQKIS